MERQAIYPTYINAPFKALGVESDDLIVGFVALGIGMIINPLVAFIAMTVVVALYRKIKKDKPRGFLQHLPLAFGLKAFKGFDDVFYSEYGE